jgi:acyl-CoA thioesterase-1
MERFEARLGRRGWVHRSLKRLGARLAGFAGGIAIVTSVTIPCALAAAAPATPATPASPPTLVVVGDSLSAEFGLHTGEGWVHLLDQRLAAEHYRYRVVNASISGDTTSGGRARLPALLVMHHPKVVVIELGGNDALRGTPIPTVRANLDAMIATARAAGARVLVVGIQVPPNYGRRYQDDFAQAFVDAAKAGHAAIVPFILKGIADREDADAWFQADRIHPVAKAHPIIVDNVWPVLKPLLVR